MSVDMFTYLNNDILQCILYEWLDIQDICQLDIAVCNHSIRPLYYEALQTSTSPLNDNTKRELTEERLYELMNWSKIRGIQNPITTISLKEPNDPVKYLFTKKIIELSNFFKTLKYTKSLIMSYWNSNLFYAFASLQYLTTIQFTHLNLETDEFAILGFTFKQLTSLTKISLVKCRFTPILFSILSEIPSLRSLEISRFFSDNLLYDLYKVTQLETLSLKDCKSYDYDELLSLSCLKTFPRLTELYIKSCDIEILDIMSLTQLKKLELNNVELDDIDTNYENYVPLYQLESIRIINTIIEQDFLQFILQSKQLKDFSFTCQYKAYSFQTIDNLSLLTHLTLEDIPMDEQLFQNICKLSQLERLTLICTSNNNNNSNNNKQIMRLPLSKLSKRLTHLTLSFKSLGNAHYFREISQLTSLIHLELSCDQIFIAAFEQLKELKYLKIRFYRNYPPDIKEQMKKTIKEHLQLPKLTIEI